MLARGKLIVAAVVLAVAGGTGYYLYAEKAKKEQQRKVAELVADTTGLLRKALTAPPSAELVARIDGNLKAAKAPRDPMLSGAAEEYIHDAREIARRRADAERLTREAALNRRALSMHMATSFGRDTYWIRVATDLKKRVERDHSELDTSLKALSSLLFSLPESQKRLEPHVGAALLLEEGERRAASARRRTRSARTRSWRRCASSRCRASGVYLAEVVAAVRGALGRGGRAPGVHHPRVRPRRAAEGAAARAVRRRRAGG